jgi:hypothetical protein
LTPLEHLLTVMRDPEADVARRMDAAKAALPYMHPRLAARKRLMLAKSYRSMGTNNARAFKAVRPLSLSNFTEIDK